MGLIDRTNEEVRLSMMKGRPLVIDIDSDSSIPPYAWVHVYGNPDNQDFHFVMTFEEAALFRDRLNLILGVDISEDLE